MAGIKVTVTSNVSSELSDVVARIENREPLFAKINEYLLRSTRQRFKDQVDPDGKRWAALSPRYLKRKHRNKDKVLTLRGHLQGLLRGQFDNDKLDFGSDRKYAAKLHYGGKFKIKGRQSTVYFKQQSDGSIGRQFVKKKQSNFAQSVQVGDHTATYPSRKFLGISKSDAEHIKRIALRHLSEHK